MGKVDVEPTQNTNQLFALQRRSKNALTAAGAARAARIYAINVYCRALEQMAPEP